MRCFFAFMTTMGIVLSCVFSESYFNFSMSTLTNQLSAARPCYPVLHYLLSTYFHSKIYARAHEQKITKFFVNIHSKIVYMFSRERWVQK